MWCNQHAEDNKPKTGNDVMERVMQVDITMCQVAYL